MAPTLRLKTLDSTPDAARPEGAVLRPPVVAVIFFFLLFAAIAIRLGTDATPDFRIYHYYNGYAALNDRTALDIAPAQLQTMVFNGLDGLNISYSEPSTPSRPC